MTEQGEVIGSKFSDREVGRRNLETMVAATLEATFLDRERASETRAFRATMETLSQHAYAAYRALVYETPRFDEYFRAATPLAEIAQLNIGSRPASRKASNAIEDLRAIPWVFSWAQSRVLLPGWYGFGSAVAALLEGAPDEKRQVAELARMRTRWPFFRMLVDNLEMVLSKTDMGIGGRGTRSSWPTARCATGSSAGSSPSASGRSTRCSRSPASASCSRRAPRWHARSGAACRTSTP